MTSDQRAALYPIGAIVAFEFDLYRVSFREPRQTRRGRGAVVSTDDYTVWTPGLTVRVTESPDYPVGTHISVQTVHVRRIPCP